MDELAEHARAERAERESVRLREALEKINAIRDSIISCRTVNWSEHVYPLVAALNEAGFTGKPWPADREYLGSIVQQRDAAIAERDAARAEVSRLQEGLDAASKSFLAAQGQRDEAKALLRRWQDEAAARRQR